MKKFEEITKLEAVVCKIIALWDKDYDKQDLQELLRAIIQAKDSEAYMHIAPVEWRLYGKLVEKWLGDEK